METKQVHCWAMPRRVQKRLLISGGLVFVIASLLTVAYLSHFFSTSQLRSTDFLFPALTPKDAHSTAIVGIDQGSYRSLLPQYGDMTQWPRTLYGKVVQALNKAGARVVLFDIIWDAPRPEDLTVASALKEAGNVLLSVEARGPGPLNPNPGVAQEFATFIRSTATIHTSAAGEGFINMTVDPDTLVRRLPLVLQAGGEEVVALSLAAVARFIRRPTVLDAPSTDSILYGAGRAIPLHATYSMVINFLGPPSRPDGEGTFPIIPFGKVLNGTFNPALVRDKIVVVGLTMPGLDEYSTPTTKNTRMWGVEVMGNAIETILHQRYLVPASSPITVSLIFLMSVLAALLVMLSRPLVATSGMIMLVGLYVVVGGACFDAGILLNMVYPPAALVSTFGVLMVFRVGVEQAQQREIRTLMGQYLSPAVSQWVLQEQENLQLRGKLQPITVLFADIRGFTTLAYTLTPETLVALLNEYLTAMTRVVLNHDGVVDKYIGDAFMAFWNAPMPQPDHARRACHTALEMLRTLRELQADWNRRSMPQFEIGIGINSGPAVVGNIGSRERLQYTALGDTTNVASRLEGLSTMYGTQIVISEMTRQEAGPAFAYRELDWVAVRGREAPLVVYELMGLASQLDPERAQVLQRYQYGLDRYRSHCWTEAQKIFSELNVAAPDDGPTALYLRRSSEFNAHPPPADWNGVYRAQTK